MRTFQKESMLNTLSGESILGICVLWCLCWIEIENCLIWTFLETVLGLKQDFGYACEYGNTSEDRDVPGIQSTQPGERPSGLVLNARSEPAVECTGLRRFSVRRRQLGWYPTQSWNLLADSLLSASLLCSMFIPSSLILLYWNSLLLSIFSSVRRLSSVKIINSRPLFSLFSSDS